MRILIVGAGGVGGYFGARLVQSGADITFLLREARYSKIQKDGLVVETPDETFTVKPKVITKDKLKPEYDLIVLAPKSFDFEDAIHSIAGASSKGVFLPFLNGLDHIHQLDDKFGIDRVLGGVAKISATISASGAVKQLTNLHAITVGHRSTGNEAVARNFFSLCEKATFDCQYSENIEQSLWDKWVFLASLAGITTLCRDHVGKICATKWGIESATSMFNESCAIAKANGFSISEAAQKLSLEMLANVHSSHAASMLRDLTQGNKTEHDHVLGQLIERGVTHGVPCSLLKIAHTHLAVEQGNRN